MRANGEIYCRTTLTTQPNTTYGRFSKLLDLAESYAQAGDFRTGFGLAQVAARYAFPGTVGLFASPRLEKLLMFLGAQLPSRDVSSHSRNTDGPKDVLHILSYGRPVGGDSRFAWRWMQEDRSNRHFVVLTTQSEVRDLYDVPHILRQAAEDSGGWLKCLSAPASQPEERVLELRKLCQEMDIAILHLFPYDILPTVALSHGCDSTKTLFINHCDHTFWSGASIAHHIAHLRTQNTQFLTQRRKLRMNCSSLLPIPLNHVETDGPSAEQAKRMLGYTPNTTVLVTIASPFKYESGRVRFLDLVEPIVRRFSNTVLIAVGPRAEGTWKTASVETGGRIVPLGTQWDNELIYRAADIYLDSVPFSSITSLLEAGVRGIPLLGLKYPADDDLFLLGAGAPGLERAMLFANDPTEYQTLLTRLVEDAAYRRTQGHRVKEEILSTHTGAGWLEFRQTMYSALDDTNIRGCLSDDDEKAEHTELTHALQQLYPKLNIRRLLANHLGHLPFATRVAITWRLYMIGFDLCVLNLLPSPISAKVRYLGSRAKYHWQYATRKLGNATT